MVMMAMVITRLVAILDSVSLHATDLTGGAEKGDNEKGTVPTSHAPQRLDAPVDIALALAQHALRVHDGLALGVQVGQRGGADGLRLRGEGLAVADALGGAVEAVGGREELLALREVDVGGVGRGVLFVGVAAREEGGAVGREGGQAGAGRCDCVLVGAEAGVYLWAGGGGDVLFFEAHLAELFVPLLVSGGRREGERGEGGMYQLVGLLEGALGSGDGGLARLARQLGDLVELLLEVGLDDLELALVRGEELGAGVGVEGVGHLVGVRGHGSRRVCSSLDRMRWELGGCYGEGGRGAVRPGAMDGGWVWG